ncbi:hypothetical protein AUR64_01725 [Haloprofundus marisrubri]|uniref:DUF8153 domain-containing protein n=1 Tax=Haloprofundus marisrubri TaxID=1514971 RepID=A0A0W1R3R6_9EURY|nr:hypothetical protein [Haloprofundus marisrubri]KTG07976.1 hypothetical protein AUR64_01725 [Haloprofundus marisrubri]
MRRSIRYALSIFVGMTVTIITLRFTKTNSLVVLSILPLYGVSTAFLLGCKDSWYRLLRPETKEQVSRKRGAIGGGIGAFTCSLLLAVSVPVGVAGIGLMLFGQTLAVADFAALQPEDSI